MDTSLLRIVIAAETDIVPVRSRTRRLAELIGFDAQDQTRITTAVSEIARNIYEYARGGHIEFRLTGEPPAQSFVIVARDRGPGIADLQAVLAGSHKSATGMGIGLLGARRLMDTFDITSKPGQGTTVRLGKTLSRQAAHITPARLARVMDTLAADGPADAVAEIGRQISRSCSSSKSCGCARRTCSGSIRNCRTPTAASLPCTPNWTNAPTTCVARTS